MIKTNQQTLFSQNALHPTKIAAGIHKPRSSYISSLDISSESALQLEIMDIIEELSMMLYLLKKQKEMVNRFIQNAQRILHPGRAVEQSFYHRKSTEKFERKYQLEWFKISASKVMSDVSNRISDLEDLKSAAENTERNVSSPCLSSFSLGLIHMKDQRPARAQATAD